MREKSRVLTSHQSIVKHDRLGNVDWDLEIRISDLQQKAKSKNEFEPWQIFPWIFFFSFGFIGKSAENGFEQPFSRTAILFKHSKIHQEYKKILNNLNYRKQYAKLSTTNLTKTCFSWMPYTQYFKIQKFRWTNRLNWLKDLASLISQGRLFQRTWTAPL